MTEPIAWEIVKGAFGFVCMILMAAGGYWCKSLSADIKELYGKSEENARLITSMSATAPLREKIQDERWSGLRASIENQNSTQAAMQRDIQALVHSRLKQTQQLT